MAEKSFFSESGLTEGEAKEVQGYMSQFFFIFMAFAIIAHFLCWFWRPWAQPEASAELIQTAQSVLTMIG